MFFTTLVLSLLFGLNAQANVCAKPASTNDVLSCLDAKHPDVLKLAADENLASGIVGAATQFPNPQVEFETLKGDNLGDTVGETRIAVTQLIEIGGKRGARTKKGRAEADVVRANSALSKDQVRVNNTQALVRYRQLLDEVAVLAEALATYEKVDRQFSARPRLSPDQQVSFSIFKLAIGDYRHKLAALEADLRRAENYFRQVPELNFAEVKKLLPKRKTSWPGFELKRGLSETPTMRLAQAEFKQAEANLDLARANSWPDPVVSLITTREVEATNEWHTVGVGVTLPLPLWNLNGGERREASALKTKAEVEFRKKQKDIELERNNLLFSYREFVEALKKSPSAKDIEQKHKNTESLFYRGVISGALVIEAHRQILEFTQTQNELERETLQTMLSLYTLEGRMDEYKYE